MALIDKNMMVFAAGALVVGVLLIKTIGVTNVVAGGVGVAADAAAGVPIGIGDVLGVPRTNLSECELAIADGRTWDASFSCSAGAFIRSVFD